MSTEYVAHQKVQHQRDPTGVVALTTGSWTADAVTHPTPLEPRYPSPSPLPDFPVPPPSPLRLYGAAAEGFSRIHGKGRAARKPLEKAGAQRVELELDGKAKDKDELCSQGDCVAVGEKGEDSGQPLAGAGPVAESAESTGEGGGGSGRQGAVGEQALARLMPEQVQLQALQKQLESALTETTRLNIRLKQKELQVKELEGELQNTWKELSRMDALVVTLMKEAGELKRRLQSQERIQGKTPNDSVLERLQKENRELQEALQTLQRAALEWDARMERANHAANAAASEKAELVARLQELQARQALQTQTTTTPAVPQASPARACGGDRKALMQEQERVRRRLQENPGFVLVRCDPLSETGIPVAAPLEHRPAVRRVDFAVKEDVTVANLEPRLRTKLQLPKRHSIAFYVPGPAPVPLNPTQTFKELAVLLPCRVPGLLMVEYSVSEPDSQAAGRRPAG